MALYRNFIYRFKINIMYFNLSSSVCMIIIFYAFLLNTIIYKYETLDAWIIDHK